jgi:hypothetical protein
LVRISPTYEDIKLQAEPGQLRYAKPGSSGGNDDGDDGNNNDGGVGIE